MFESFRKILVYISISIGAENKNDEVKKCSIVKASYKLGDRNLEQLVLLALLGWIIQGYCNT